MTAASGASASSTRWPMRASSSSAVVEERADLVVEHARRADRWITPIASEAGSSTQAAAKAPSWGGAAYVSPGSGPAMTSSISAQSATLRAIGPFVAKPSQAS